MKTWTPRLNECLRALWAQGKSGGQIAAMMDGFSRSAVLAHARTLDLPRRGPTSPMKGFKRLEPRSMLPPPRAPFDKLEAERRRQLRVRDARRKKKRVTPVLNTIEKRKTDPALPKLLGDRVGSGVPFLEIGPRRCHYVLGEPIANALMCGSPTDGRRYCAHHHELCHERTRRSPQPFFTPAGVAELKIAESI